MESPSAIHKQSSDSVQVGGRTSVENVRRAFASLYWSDRLDFRSIGPWRRRYHSLATGERQVRDNDLRCGVNG